MNVAPGNNTESRRFPLITLQPYELQARCALLWPGRRLAHAELLTDGLCNTNYRVTMDGLSDAFVLRLYVRDPSACQREHDIFRHAGHGLPIPEFLFVEPTGRLGHPFAITRFVPGTPMRQALKEGVHAVDSIARAAGSVLARLGQFHFDRAGCFGVNLRVERWPFEVDGCDPGATYMQKALEHGVVARRLGPARTDRMRRFIDRNAECMQDVGHSITLVHGDFNRSNMLFSRDDDRWAVAALLDWEWSHAGTSMMDIGNMLRDVSHLPHSFQTSFLAGYRDGGGVLPERWKKISMFVDMSSHCEFLAEKRDDDEYVAACIRWIDRTLDDWDSF
jgi:aminoglycoside phosphotransferase (APT) family kinase protein